jgi:hypothetical protein
MEKDIELIEMIIQKYKPEGIYKLLLDIEPTSGRVQYYINPQYIIDKDDSHDYMDIEWKGDINWRTKGDRVYDKFEKNMINFIKRVTNIDVYFRGRGVTEKEYWLHTKDRNQSPNF